jgi:hypothetical protein
MPFFTLPLFADALASAQKLAAEKLAQIISTAKVLSPKKLRFLLTARLLSWYIISVKKCAPAPAGAFLF